MQNDFTFVSLEDPVDRFTNGDPLPLIQGTVNSAEEKGEEKGAVSFWRATEKDVMKKGKYSYIDMMAYFLRKQEGMLQKWADKMGYKTDQRDAPPEKEKRVLREITSTKVFQKNCLGKKACGIAFLPAIDSIDYEAKSHKERIKILEEKEAFAEKASLPVYYSWVNTTCHPEWLKMWNVPAFSTPTVVFYNPARNVHETMIGKFTKSQISDYEDRFVRGKLPTVKTPTEKDEILLEEKDCQAHAFDANEEDDDFDDILAEILAEEKERN